MAKRTYIDPRTNQCYRKGKTNMEEYDEWRTSYSPKDMLCLREENISNPAWIDSHTSEENIQKAQDVCNDCALKAGCEFFVGTKVFEGFDGVMGAVYVEDTLDAEEEVPEKV